MLSSVNQSKIVKESFWAKFDSPVKYNGYAFESIEAEVTEHTPSEEDCDPLWFSAKLVGVKLTSKGEPDKREKSGAVYHEEASYLIAAAMMQSIGKHVYARSFIDQWRHRMTRIYMGTLNDAELVEKMVARVSVMIQEAFGVKEVR